LLPFERLLSHPLGVDVCIDLTQYPTEESCLAKLEAAGVCCTKCHGHRVKRTRSGNRVTGRPGHHWWCGDCRRQFSSLAGSPFEGTHQPLRLWFAAIHLLLRSNGTIRVSELAYLLDVKRTTAARMLARLAGGLHTKGGNNSGPDSGGHL
jgi:transposase-like protein